MSMVKLASTVRLTKNNPSVTADKKSATITILVVTIIYLVFNTPLLVFHLVRLSHYWGIITLPVQSYVPLMYLDRFLQVVAIGLNASINPIIYFSRIRKFRAYCFSWFYVTQEGGRLIMTRLENTRSPEVGSEGRSSQAHNCFVIQWRGNCATVQCYVWQTDVFNNLAIVAF